METTIAVMSSVTHAMKGRGALERYGIRSAMERNKSYGISESCAYILRIQANPATVREIFIREGVKVKSFTVEGGKG